MKLIAESGIAKAAEDELLIPDPPNAMEILENATKPRTTEDNSNSNRQNCS